MGKDTKHVVVLGIGGAGVKIANGVSRLNGAENVMVALADTDQRTLAGSTEDVIEIPLGKGWNCQHGCGADMQLGEKATGAAQDDLKELLQDANLAIVVAGLGGGTGSGGARLMARLAQELAVPVLFVVTLPFAFEGNWRRRQADSALSPLRDLTDTVIAVQNDLLFNSLPADTVLDDAFNYADQLLSRAIFGLAGMARAEWMLSADFTAIKKLLKRQPEICYVGLGVADSEDRVGRAVEEFAQSPLLGGELTMKSAEAAVVTMLTGYQLSVGELKSGLTALQERFNDNAEVLLGACTSTGCGNEIQITGLVCCSAENDEKSDEHPQSYEVADTETGKNLHNEKSNTSRKKNDRRKPVRDTVQEELPLQEQSAGMFSGSSPTVFEGENLDIPTFQRRGIKIEQEI
ncbi:MAG: hypothetical protein ACOCZS_03075, partial [Verrucomicrobiota bacterium]